MWPLIGGLMSTAANGLLQFFGAKKQNEQQINLANKAQQHDIDMYNMQKQGNIDFYNTQWNNTLSQWNAQNEYNSPKSQMQRYVDAGLNPNLIYSQGNPGSASTVTSPAISVPSAPKSYIAGVVNQLRDVQLPNMLNVLNQYQDWKMKKAQTDQIEANTELLGKRVVTEGYNATLKDLLGRNIDYDLGFKEITTNGRYAGIIQDVILDAQRTRNLQLENDLAKFRLNTLFPLESANWNLRNKQLQYNLDTWNPTKLKQLNIMNEQQGLDLDINKGLAPHNASMRDPILWKMWFNIGDAMDRMFGIKK